jgi:hypothetical protein
LIRLAIQKLSMQLFALGKAAQRAQIISRGMFRHRSQTLRDRRAFQTKPSEIRGWKRSTENQDFEPKNVFKRSKKPFSD